MNKMALVAGIAVLVGVIGGYVIINHKKNQQAVVSHSGAAEAQKEKEEVPPPIKLKLFMIAQGDRGIKGKEVACNDSAVEVEVPADDVDYVSGIYRTLVALHDNPYPGTDLANPLAASQLKVQSATIDSAGTAHVALTGSISWQNTCDAARIKTQLQEPALRFYGVKAVEITIDGIPLDQTLSVPSNL